jgi:hypothetical protein
MGGRQAVRPWTLDPVSKVRILPAQPVCIKENWSKFKFVALLNRRGAMPSLVIEPSGVNSSSEAAETWAERIIVHTTEGD